MGKKMFFLDIDGTTLDDNNLPPEENLEAIRETLDGGDYIAISTGRPLSGARPVARSLGMLRGNCFLISFNGAVIYDLETGELLSDRRMPDEYTSYLFAEAERAGLYLQAYDEEYFWAAGECPESEFYAKMIGTPCKVVPDLYHLGSYHTPKVLALALGDTSPLHRFREDHLAWEEGKCCSFFSRPYLLEYCSADATKESGIAFFEEYLGLSHEDTIAVGDAENDLSMIKAAGTGVAMCNGTEKVRSAADYVTRHDNNEGGVAETLRKFRTKP